MDNNKVMIVEDDPLLSIVEERLVVKSGYDVIGKATSGEQALALVEDLHPNILIMDIQLEGSMNGIETVSRLRKNHFDIPVIFLSGDNDSDILEKAHEMNCVEYLLKPVSAEVLTQALSKASGFVSKKAQYAA